MTITPVQDLVAAFTRASTSSTSSQVSSVVSAATTAPVQTDTTSVSSASSSTSSSLQALNQTSVGLAELGSVLDLAQSGTSNLRSVLQQLQSLAEEATQGGPPSALAILNSEFQNVLTKLSHVAEGANFNGSNLLDGTLSSASSTLSIPNLSTAGLFGNSNPNLLNVSSAGAALNAVTNAQGVVSTAANSIAATQQQVSQASAGVDTALANITASTSTLTEADFNNGATGDVLTNLLSNPSASANTQTNHLPGTLLNLLQE